MKILAIEPLGTMGHINFNSYFLKVLSEIGHVTFVAPSAYMADCGVSSRIDIPQALMRHQSKVGGRWSQIRVLSFVVKNVHLDDYDAIIFLAYETISFCLRWPRHRQVFLFEHNNIDNAQNSHLKLFFYGRLPAHAVHFVFQRHVTQYLQDRFNRRSIVVPHPYYRSDLNDAGHCQELSVVKGGDKKILFSPSASSPVFFQMQIINFAKEHKDSFYVYCKGNPAKRTENMEVQPFFENYEKIIQNCDFVFVGARFDYRVSGVAYEALSYGKPIVLMHCLFAHKLRQEYPNLVISIHDFNELLSLKPNNEKMNQEHKLFLREHSFDSIRTVMDSALRRNLTE